MKYPRFSRFTACPPSLDLSDDLSGFHVSRRFLVFPFSRLLVFLVTATFLITTTAFAQLVDIPDPNLKDAITEALELPANTLITQQDMLQLMTLDIRGSSIANLTGLEDAANLEVLYSMNNQVTDITPLANLTDLRYLYLGDNALETIEPLAGLINLRVLDLYNTGIKDITPLANLAALESLVIVRNMIEDISPLVGLKNLKRLRLAENPIQDFTPLAQLEGVELDLNIDLSRLDQLTLAVEIPDSNLRQVVQETLSLPDGVLPTQWEMLRLTELLAWQREIADLTGLQYATNLERLILWDNQIADLSPLANLTKLKELNLAYNAVESVEPLAGLIQLRRLNLTLNRVQDITPLANLANLEKLYIRENLVTDITPVQGLNLIEFVYDEVCALPPVAPPVSERIESRSFPSVFQAWDSVLGFDHLTADERSALHDLHFTPWFVGWDQTPTEPAEGLATSLAGNLALGLESYQRRIAQNPNMVFLFTIDRNSYFADEVLPPGSDLWLRDENGEIVRSEAGSPQLNFLTSEVQDLLVKRIIGVARCGLYDGIMLDGFNHNGTGFTTRHLFSYTDEEIIQATLNIFKAVRSQVRDDFLILINANRSKATRFTEYVNGTFMETGSDNEYLTGMPGGYTHDGLKEIESTLLWSEENLRSPQINSLEGWGIPSEPPDSPANRRYMRVITTLSLTHSDGYVMYNTGWGAVSVCDECPYPWGPGHEHIWYDFWDANLGRPVGHKAELYQNVEGLFIREFTNGWAVYNRSGSPQEISLTESVTGVSNGKSGTTHQLPDLDGEIYLKAPNLADVNADGKVNILDLVQVANGLGTAAPDPNGDGVVNLLDLVFVSQQFRQ